MKKIILIAVLLLVVMNGRYLADYFYPRESGGVGNMSGVILYTTSWCGACKKTKDFLDRRGIAYVEYDIEWSAEGRRQFEAFGGRGVPLVVINGTQVIGYNPDKMKRLLGL